MNCGNIDATTFTIDDHITTRTVCCPILSYGGWLKLFLLFSVVHVNLIAVGKCKCTYDQVDSSVLDDVYVSPFFFLFFASMN